MSYRGFGKGSGPSAPPHSKPTFGSNPFPRPLSSSPSTPPGTATFLVPPPFQPVRPRFIESSGRNDGQKLLYRDLDALPPEGSSAFTTFVASRDSTAGVSARVYRYPNPEKTRSPPVVYLDDEVSRKSGQTVLRNPAIASAPSDNQTSVPDNYPNLSQHYVQSSVSPYFGSHNPQQSFTKELNSVQVLKRTRSPPSPSANKVSQENFNVARKDFRRPSISPPRLANRLNFQSAGPQPQIHQKSLPSTSTASEAALSMPISSTAPKRTRSPPLTISADETLEGNSISSEDNVEREMIAKAKRLARFKLELSKSEQNSSDVPDQKASANRHVQSILEEKHVGGQSMELTRNFTNGHNFSDYEGSETSSIIIGLCPDMCPESERAERERKGDLDQYERLDGDRNVTSRNLAVKKYNRTAEREASLIRPMPILRNTIDYLLNLLDQPYDERFLGIYNFLWDRMRAIRMDLRMQHIFNQGAIAMLEQMIRLHIIAMHELCEYTKGEGFSEGFDAHLNIEQMNKTSVELFQMYDDHRKKGTDVPTEKEFRGYYALLKLDKHPGYRVEPAELSLDLAQMTPEIRQTPEVLFARNVARACRTGNFIAFFRLARKASYLQACLMHAHFAKLRTQALASLHSGLPNNQGLPVSHVANWLAMEDEDIEGLVEYHGFSLKAFEEPYMVKEGPFLNVDNEYPTKCSKLVYKKRSGSIVKDVSPSIQVVSLPVQTPKEIQRRKTYKHEAQLVSSVQKGSSVQKVEEMPDTEAIVLPKDVKSGLAFKGTPISIQHSENRTASPRPSPFNFSYSSNISAPQLTRSVISMSPNSPQLTRSLIMNPNSDTTSSSPKRKLNSTVDERPLEFVTRPAQPEMSLGHSCSFSAPISSAPIISQDEPLVIPQENEGEIVEIENYQDEEVAEAKLKLFLRLWRRRASKLRMLREQRQLAANAALDSLSLGPPIRHYIDQPGNLDMFDINKAMRERYDKQEKSWARLNVSEVVADKLSRRNSDAKCLCWKIILCSQMNSGYKIGSAGSWLISKLMPSSDDDVVASSPGLAIWKKWVPSQSGADPSCCISVIRDTTFGSLDETVSGASAVLFLVSESISWELQKAHLHNILTLIPSGAHLPLLILCGSCEEGVSSVIINALGLKDIDNSRVSGFLLVFLIENQHIERLGGFFSDERLREGLEWLASESPLQPTLHCVKTRELIHTHLNSLSGARESINNPKLGPNDCISVFNAALDYTAEEIIGAANANPTGWPCPEIALLDEFSDEDILVKGYLPAMGWSSNAKIEPIICALRECKLPAFPHDLSWLAKGSNAGYEIENHRSKLENSLIEYLTHTSKMMGESLATKEALVTLQTCARLQLSGSSYRIVPLWSAIFRRIFNWRLTSLVSGESSSAYILECHHIGPTSSVLDPGLEAGVPPSYYQTASLDEIIEVGCNSPLLVKGQPRSEAIQHPPQRGSNGIIHETVEESDVLDGETNFALDKLPVSNNDSMETLTNGKATKEADRLSKLLEQCNLLQDVIGEKLSVFF